jgi:glycosyltransferase involved in cell wall biosynthesis
VEAHSRPRGTPGTGLTVVVPVRDGQSVLPECLSAIFASQRPPDEVLVVDDGSSDDSGAIARTYGAQVISHGRPARGPAWARNQGAGQATGDILIFVDADVVVHPDTLQKMEGRFSAEPALEALFGSYDDSPRARTTVSRFKNLLHHYVHQHGRPLASTFWAGCGAVRRKTFLELGGFDENYREPSIEDIELGVRLTRAGKLIRLFSDIQCTHLKRWTFSNLVRTDIFARAVPWTRLVLREGRLPDDLNLSWKSRASAVCAWGGLAALILSAVTLGFDSRLLGAVALAAGALCFLASTLLNAELHRFFFRQGGFRFAGSTWLLHHTYLLYSSATFAGLALCDSARRAALHVPRGRRKTESPRPTRPGAG